MQSEDVHKFIDDPEGLYLFEVQKVPRLSPEEEIRCLQHIRAGDEQAEPSKQRLVEANLRLVVSIAERNRNDRVHFLDLIAKGNDGLMDALQAFDTGEGSFSAHATACIERAIAEALASPDPLRIPPPHVKAP
jgi:RNA polymerase primary sigma factor